MAAEQRLDGAALLTQLMSDLATVLGALVGATGTALPAVGAFEPSWIVAASVGGRGKGTLSVGLSSEDASTFTRLVLGSDEPPDDQSIVDMLQEVAGQAFSSLGQQPVAAGLTFSVSPPRRGSQGAPSGSPSVFRLAVSDAFNPVVGGWAEVADAEAVAAPPAKEPSHGVGAATAHAGAKPALPANLDVILDIDLPLSVRFGETEMTLEALTRLGPGSMIDLGRSADDPVEVLVNGRLVARAEVVVVAGNYGVRILEIVSAADRLRAMNT